MQYVADDPTSYYPFYVAYDIEDDGEDNLTMVPSLAWAAYRQYASRRPALTEKGGQRDLLHDDRFPVWRKAVSAKNYVFCSFAVRQLLPDAMPGDASCPRETLGATSEAQGNMSIKLLVKNKIVLIGQAGQGNKDWIETPFDVDQPGVMLHATVLDDLLVFGPGRYPVNRDGAVLSVGRIELRMSELYFLIGCTLPLLFIPIGHAIAKSRIAPPVVKRIADHTTIIGAVVSLLVIPLMRPSLATLNAFVVLVSMYVILALANLVEEWIKRSMEGRHA